MKSSILLLALITAAFSSCTTAYKTGQTPDDVYYSPARPQDEYVRSEKEDDRQYRNNDEYYDDRYLRMKVKNRSRWADLDDSYYYSRRYDNSVYLGSCFGNPWTPYTYWNNYYNPYNHNYTIVSPKTLSVYNGPRTFNLNTYNSNSLTNNNYINPKYNNAGNNSYNNNNYNGARNSSNSNSSRNSNSGNILRNIFNGGDNNNSNSSSKGGSSSSSSSGSSSSSSSSGSSTAPVRRF